MLHLIHIKKTYLSYSQVKPTIADKQLGASARAMRK